MDLMLAAVDLAEGGEAADVVARCDAWGPAIDQLTVAFLSTFRLLLLARALVETGDVDRARSTADLALAAAEQSGNQWLRVAALEEKAGALRAVDEAAQAEETAHELLAAASEHHFRPEVARGLEILAGLAVTSESWSEGVRLAAAASTWRDESGCRAWPIDGRRLQADLDLARTAIGDDEWAVAWSEGAALSVADAVAYARRARGERRRPSSGWASLTPTETDVVRLVAEGLTNPDIATRLFVSRATVKTHLVHVFSKLGVATRAELAAAATRRGIAARP
jgi:DNA-binding CsgD family transcriptional regulator